jgi:hypothetical protein
VGLSLVRYSFCGRLGVGATTVPQSSNHNHTNQEPEDKQKETLAVGLSSPLSSKQ